MISLNITDTKSFMNHLFKEVTFDTFSFRVAEIHSFCEFEIKAPKTIEKLTWLDMKPYVFNIIKGKTTPKSIKLILTLDSETAKEIDSGGEYFFNIYFTEGVLNVVTGTSAKVFTLDKTMDNLWEDYVSEFLTRHEITFTEDYDEA